MTIYDGSTFTHEGLEFHVRIEPDDNYDPPWERSDGHGPVRLARGTPHTCGKRAGERILHSDRHTVWLYDWQKACELARRDGWNTKPYDAPNRIERAVQADFDFLRRWLDEQWCYVGVCVSLADQAPDYAHSVWGIESDASDYIEETAHELADEIISERRTAWRKAMREARERKRWAQRDVITSA